MRKLVAALTAAVALALLPAPAHAEWSRARPMDRDGWNASDDVDSAAARNGTTLMAWASISPDGAGPTEIHYRRVTRSGRLGALRVLPTDPGGSPGQVSVVVDDDGDALITWASFQYVDDVWQTFARRVSRDGVVGPLRRLSDPTVDTWRPVAALAPRGAGVVVLDDGRGTVLRRISGTSRLGKPRRLPKSGLVRVTATRDGHFLTAGTNADGIVVAFRLLPDNRLLSRRVSAGTPGTDTAWDIGADRAGNAYLTYRAVSSQRSALWTRVWRRAGALGPARRITPRTHGSVMVAARTDLEGDTVVSWSRFVDYRLFVYTRFLRRDGSIGPVHRLGRIEAGTGYQPPTPTPVPGLALDDDGDGVVTWPVEHEYGRQSSWARRIRRDGSVGPLVRLAYTGRPHGLAVTPDGTAHVGITHGFTERLLLRTGP